MLRWNVRSLLTPFGSVVSHKIPWEWYIFTYIFIIKNQAKVGKTMYIYIYISAMDGMGQAIDHIPKWWICIPNAPRICIWMLWFGHSTLDATSKLSFHILDFITWSFELFWIILGIWQSFFGRCLSFFSTPTLLPRILGKVDGNQPGNVHSILTQQSSFRSWKFVRFPCIAQQLKERPTTWHFEISGI